MDDLLELVAREGGEELRLESGNPPVMGLHGTVRIIDGAPLSPDEVAELFRSIASGDQQRELGQCGDTHFTFASRHSDRFAVNAALKGEVLSLRIKNLRR